MVAGRVRMSATRSCRESVEIIRALHAGGYVRYRGRHFDIDSARVWDLPDEGVPIGIAISGPSSAALAGELADAMIAVEPDASLGELFDQAGGTGRPRYGQLAVCYDRDEAVARERAWDQFRWFSSGWKVNAELPGTAAFAAASGAVRREDVASRIPCGPDLEPVLEAIDDFRRAGFTHLALVQVGGDHQEDFIEWAASDLLAQAHKQD